MLSSPFPASVAFRVTTKDDLANFELFAAEQVSLSPRAVASRRLHFQLGRAAARSALADLGVAPQAIPKAEDGRPVWPAGVVGAITHTAGVAAAAAGRADEWAGLGIDLESRGRRVSPEVVRRVCSEREFFWVQQGEISNDRALMVFSAKESIFKSLYPLEQVFLGFGDAELVWSPEAGEFVAELKKKAAPAFGVGARFSVGCRIVKGLVMAYTHLPKEPSS